jgi:hypothetical protein
MQHCCLLLDNTCFAATADGSNKLPAKGRAIEHARGTLGRSDSGASDSDVSDSGANGSGTSVDRVGDSGVSDSGVSDSGTSDNGVSSRGASDSGASTNMAERPTVTDVVKAEFKPVGMPAMSISSTTSQRLSGMWGPSMQFQTTSVAMGSESTLATRALTLVSVIRYFEPAPVQTGEVYFLPSHLAHNVAQQWLA